MLTLHRQPCLPVYNKVWQGKQMAIRGNIPFSLATHVQKKHKLSKVPHCLKSGMTFSLTETLKDEGKRINSLKNEVSRIEIRTLKDCRLGIAMYPDFVYNADGGGGLGAIEKCEDGNKLAVVFDTPSLYIPPVESKTTRFLGLPLPPFIRIQIVPRHFKGFIDKAEGKVELEFSADFMFSIGSLYRAPPLAVDTLLTTEVAKGHMRQGEGRRLDSHGNCKLVGVAPIVRVNDVFMNAFLTLPTECLAIMQTQLTFFD